MIDRRDCSATSSCLPRSSSIDSVAEWGITGGVGTGGGSNNANAGSSHGLLVDHPPSRRSTSPLLGARSDRLSLVSPNIGRRVKGHRAVLGRGRCFTVELESVESVGLNVQPAFWIELVYRAVLLGVEEDLSHLKDFEGREFVKCVKTESKVKLVLELKWSSALFYGGSTSLLRIEEDLSHLRISEDSEIKCETVFEELSDFRSEMDFGVTLQRLCTR
ncbi:hypothetical protein WH47_00367 [Habropoda laboriosa]|uniref:Uncharacterized protein n=1 Tax=Habropoda laboriosa TaxID=597456 RepID=A0A0L7QKK6_9HYME|nr:hypothetical protein WH47_00367 [Habropoda laboriosa]